MSRVTFPVTFFILSHWVHEFFYFFIKKMNLEVRRDTVSIKYSSIYLLIFSFYLKFHWLGQYLDTKPRGLYMNYWIINRESTKMQVEVSSLAPHLLVFLGHFLQHIFVWTNLTLLTISDTDSTFYSKFFLVDLWNVLNFNFDFSKTAPIPQKRFKC